VELKLFSTAKSTSAFMHTQARHTDLKEARRLLAAIIHMFVTTTLGCPHCLREEYEFLTDRRMQLLAFLWFRYP